MNQSRIQENVMRRVRTIHTLRPLVSTTALSAFLLLGALWGIGREVWVARVFENMPSLSDAAVLSRFMLSAFLHTDFLVQALSVLAIAAFVWLVSDGLRTLRSVPRFV